ncbi:DGQHR domain-containing protein [uncultured Thalassospira sp.]|uniref:DGQHR domain-containing protein n=1 Tax=uncultured Thalassospira sp. TaxID=404382 RepID=UPI0025837689|nr:DGQHR domain-containing protein [uncultured Thalassospira sp.]
MTDQFNFVDPDVISFTFECLKATQPIGDIFLAKISHTDLIKITHFDVRRVLQEDRDVEKYLGIQRPLIKSKVDALHKYVNFFDASFPTAIIIAIKEEYVEYDEDKRTITISNTARDENEPSIPISNIARVLDGQHRIAGLKDFQGKFFEVPVTIFVGADISDQAHIFATVNLEQQKVHKSLTYDLYSLAKSRSPQKTCHNVAVALDQDKNSPFYERIKRLGVATVGRDFEPISQATFVESLMKYISKDPKEDRDTLLRGKSLPKISNEDLYVLPFRNMFISNEDMKIAEVIFNYFSAVKERWPVAWANNDKGNILNRTNGFKAFMRAYEHVHRLHGLPSGVVPPHFIKNYMAAVNLHDKDFNTDNFKPGSAGESALLSLLKDVRI